MLNMTYDNDIHTHTYGYSAHSSRRAAEQHAPLSRVRVCVALCALRTHAGACAGALSLRWLAHQLSPRCHLCAPCCFSELLGVLEFGSLVDESGLQRDYDG